MKEFTADEKFEDSGLSQTGSRGVRPSGVGAVASTSVPTAQEAEAVA